MIEYEVESREGFAAALRSAACRTYDEAMHNPFRISLLGTHFKLTAPRGMHEHGADLMAKRVLQAPKWVFKVTV
jgi:hypothetical protein